MKVQYIQYIELNSICCINQENVYFVVRLFKNFNLCKG